MDDKLQGDRPENLPLWPGRKRTIVEGIAPQIDGGRFAIKRVVGDAIEVRADVFTDGHDLVAADVLFRTDSDSIWQRVAMEPLVNDRWRGTFRVEEVGRYFYTVEGWVDHFATWRYDLAKRKKASQDLTIEFRFGARILRQAALHAEPDHAQQLNAWADQFERLPANGDEAYELAQKPEIAALARRYPDPETVKRVEREFPVTVDRLRARYSSWYEFFPRSTAGSETQHGTFKTAAERLPYVADMGFDVVYLPPIHPIGQTFRKGKNNAVQAEPEDVGSPWAIGGADGGHKSVHPDLGTLDDFRNFVQRAKDLGMEVALDIAFQVSPDHPYAEDHKEWFLVRPDGTIQYAENPPKKYQDIYPFYFETEDWQALWTELKSVFEFWIEHGVKVFRVDNPHTKSFRFWEWCIGELKRDHPDLIFLAEAFTRPKVMHRLAKVGFTQSYTYFTWRVTKYELTQYFTELTREAGREYFRPNVWPNTPDILHASLQTGGRPASVVRLLLATTLAANYGIYGPAFELYESVPREPGSEEYKNSEKYQIRKWDLDRPDSLRDLIRRMNELRRNYPALQQDWTLRFHQIDNDQLIAYSKSDPQRNEVIVVIVNLDLHYTQSGWLHLPLEDFGLHPEAPYRVEELLTGARYLWRGHSNFVQLDPHGQSAHVLKLESRPHREQDLPSYM